MGAAPALAGEIVVNELGNAGSDNSGNYTYKLNVFEPDRSATLLHISPFITSDPMDQIYFVVYREVSNGTWELEWDSGPVTIGGGSDFKDSPEIDYVLEVGQAYALGFYMASSTVTYYYGGSAAGTSIGWGDHVGTMYTDNGSIGALPDPLNDTVNVGNVYHGSVTVELFDDLDEDGWDLTVDCDDDNPDINPGMDELCDAIDHDCDGKPYNDVAYIDWYPDADGDDFGDASGTPISSCEPEGPDGHVDNPDDCDDSDKDINPDEDEECDDRDQDCDGEIDEELPLWEWYRDFDLDGWGDADIEPEITCDPFKAGYVLNNGDCDDDNDLSYPGGWEICDGVDNDCDGSVLPDENDDDGDGVRNCDDCAPEDPEVFPGAAEPCNGVDNNCDGVIPEGLECDIAPAEEIDSGCSTTGGVGLWWGWLALVGLATRRRS